MTALDLSYAPTGPAPARRDLLAGWEPTLTAAGLALAASMLVTGGLALSDPRLLEGVGVWVKPLKFQASISLFWLWAAFVFSRLPAAAARSRAGLFVVWASIAAGLFEIVYIAWRASRAEASHFNFSTPTSTIFYALMGVGSVLLTSTALVQGIMVLRGPDRASVQRALGWGLILTFALGTFMGGWMSSQLSHFSHYVGANSGPGLPLVGWSTTAGDLRPAHFLGVHAAQILPMAVLAATVVARGRPPSWLVPTAVAGFTVLTLAVFAQALAGQPLIAL